MRGTDSKRTLDALAAGLAVVRRAWREAATPLTVTAAGWTAVFVAGRAALPPAAASALGWTGLALVLLMAAPKLGALHRLAAGPEARDAPGRWGLQWTSLEPRLAATAIALAAAGLLLCAGLGVTAAVLLTALRPLGRPALLLLSATALAAAWGLASVAGRFSVTLAADATEPAPRFARGWLLTRRAGAAPAAVWLVTFALPGVALLAAPAAVDLLVGGSAGRGSAGEATAVGALLAVASQFLAAPLNAGALAQLRRSALAQAAVDTAEALGDKAAAPPPVAPELLPA